MKPDALDRLANLTWSVATPQFALGLFIMLMGTSLVLARLGVVDARLVLALWPSAIILFGVTVWVRCPGVHGRFWGFAAVFVGTSLLVNALGFADVRRRDLFAPLLLMALGASIALGTLQHRRRLRAERRARRGGVR